jgi:broad specificity phosphatase PhoE
MTNNFPKTIWLVRHGESAGNVARQEAEAHRSLKVKLPQRDIDVPLSSLGERQARALGKWFAGLGDEEKPTVVISSPYVRTRETVRLMLEETGIDLEKTAFITDERLREKEFGIFDRLTKQGVREKYPEQYEMRNALGKFYHRPPGGESWCDVILRLRSMVNSLRLEFAGERVLIVTHEVVISCFRYLLENLTEEELLAIDRAHDVANCSITSYEFDSTSNKQKMKLALSNYTTHLEEVGEEITTQPDKPFAPK